MMSRAAVKRLFAGNLINSKISSPPLCSKLGISWCHQIANHHDHDQQQQGQIDVPRKIVSRKKIDQKMNHWLKIRKIVEIEGEDELRPVFEKKGSWSRMREILSGEVRYTKRRNLVVWDMDTAPLPKPEYAPHLWRNITCWLYDRRFYGPVELRAYGDKNKMPSAVWDQLLQGRGTFTHVPSEGGDVASFFYILTDLAMSTMDRPSTIKIIISGDDRLKGFGTKYLINCEYPTVAVPPLHSDGKAYAGCIWMWEDVAAGGSSLQSYLEGL